MTFNFNVNKIILKKFKNFVKKYLFKFYDLKI